MNLRRLRIDKGWSRDEMARQTGLTHQTLRRIENGDRPSPATAKKIADQFDLLPTELFPELLDERRAA